MGALPNPPAEWVEHDKRVRPYVRAQEQIRSIRLCLLLTVTWWMLVSRHFSALEGALTGSGLSGFTLFLAYFGLLAIGWELLTFPLTVWSYRIERRYGLSKQTWNAWIADQVKGWAVGSGLGLIALWILWFCVTYLGPHGWFYLALLFILFSVVLAQLAPVLLLPLFFKMDPLPQGPLREKLFDLCSRFGVSIREIYLLGLGEKTEKGNAAFMGLGRTKRIAIGDTIYRKHPAELVVAVFAHELGHLIHRDIWRGLGLSSVLLITAFGLAHWISVEWVLPKWFTWLSAPFGLTLYLIAVGLISVPLGFIEKIYSRSRERKADAFAARELGMGRDLADALEKLTLQNQALFLPSRWRELLTYSHPAPWRRIKQLRGG